MTPEQMARKILRLRLKQVAMTEQEIADAVQASRKAWNDRRDAELAELEAYLRSRANGLDAGQVGKLIDLTARLTTTLYYAPGGPIDLETYLAGFAPED